LYRGHYLPLGFTKLRNIMRRPVGFGGFVGIGDFVGAYSTTFSMYSATRRSDEEKLRPIAIFRRISVSYGCRYLLVKICSSASSAVPSSLSSSTYRKSAVSTSTSQRPRALCTSVCTSTPILRKVSTAMMVKTDSESAFQ